MMLGERVEVGQSRNAIWNGSAWIWIGNQPGQNGNTTILHPNDQIVINSATLVNDASWSWSVGANETWAFVAYPLIN